MHLRSPVEEPSTTRDLDCCWMAFEGGGGRGGMLKRHTVQFLKLFGHNNMWTKCITPGLLVYLIV